jgi:hypothetical protein
MPGRFGGFEISAGSDPFEWAIDNGVDGRLVLNIPKQSG